MKKRAPHVRRDSLLGAASAPRRGLAAAAVASLLLTACAVLTVDVDVYRGPLANEKDVRMEQIAAMAVGARPLLVRLREDLALRETRGNVQLVKVVEGVETLYQNLDDIKGGAAGLKRRVRQAEDAFKRFAAAFNILRTDEAAPKPTGDVETVLNSLKSVGENSVTPIFNETITPQTCVEPISPDPRFALAEAYRLFLKPEKDKNLHTGDRFRKRQRIYCVVRNSGADRDRLLAGFDLIRLPNPDKDKAIEEGRPHHTGANEGFRALEDKGLLRAHAAYIFDGNDEKVKCLPPGGDEKELHRKPIQDCFVDVVSRVAKSFNDSRAELMDLMRLGLEGLANADKVKFDDLGTKLRLVRDVGGFVAGMVEYEHLRLVLADIESIRNPETRARLVAFAKALDRPVEAAKAQTKENLRKAESRLKAAEDEDKRIKQDAETARSESYKRADAIFSQAETTFFEEITQAGVTVHNADIKLVKTKSDAKQRKDKANSDVQTAIKELQTARKNGPADKIKEAQTKLTTAESELKKVKKTADQLIVNATTELGTKRKQAEQNVRSASERMVDERSKGNEIRVAADALKAAEVSRADATLADKLEPIETALDAANERTIAIDWDCGNIFKGCPRWTGLEEAVTRVLRDADTSVMAAQALLVAHRHFASLDFWQGPDPKNKPTEIEKKHHAKWGNIPLHPKFRDRIRRAYGLTRGPITNVSRDSRYIATLQRSLASVRAVAEQVEAFQSGRLPNGLFTMIEEYLDATDRELRDEDEIERKRRRLMKALIRFAEKMRFVVNHESLFSASTDSLGNEDYVRVLQSVANSIIVHVDDYWRETKHEDKLVKRKDSEISAINYAYGGSPAEMFQRLLASLKSDQTRQERLASDLNRNVREANEKIGKLGSRIAAAEKTDKEAKAREAKIEKLTKELEEYPKALEVLKNPDINSRFAKLHEAEKKSLDDILKFLEQAKKGKGKKLSSKIDTTIGVLKKNKLPIAVALSAISKPVKPAGKTGEPGTPKADELAAKTVEPAAKAVAPESPGATIVPRIPVTENNIAKVAPAKTGGKGAGKNKPGAAAKSPDPKAKEKSALEIISGVINAKQETDQAGLKNLTNERDEAAADVKAKREEIKTLTKDLGRLEAQVKSDKLQIDAAGKREDALESTIKTLKDNVNLRTKAVLAANSVKNRRVGPILIEALLAELKDLKNSGKNVDVASLEVAIGVLANTSPPTEPPPGLGDDANNAREVYDQLIAALEHQRLKAIADQGEESDDAIRATQAVVQAYHRRTDMVYLRPALPYLRTSFASSSLQNNRIAWKNMLENHALRAGVPFLPTFKAEGEAKIASEIDSQFWLNVNRVRVAGAGRTNYAIAKDDVGNWYVKGVHTDPKDIIKGAKSLALFAAGGATTGFLPKGKDAAKDAAANGGGTGGGTGGGEEEEQKSPFESLQADFGADYKAELVSALKATQELAKSLDDDIKRAWEARGLKIDEKTTGLEASLKSDDKTLVAARNAKIEDIEKKKPADIQKTLRDWLGAIHAYRGMVAGVIAGKKPDAFQRPADKDLVKSRTNERDSAKERAGDAKEAANKAEEAADKAQTNADTESEAAALDKKKAKGAAEKRGEAGEKRAEAKKLLATAAKAAKELEAKERELTAATAKREANAKADRARAIDAVSDVVLRNGLKRLIDGAITSVNGYMKDLSALGRASGS